MATSNCCARPSASTGATMSPGLQRKLEQLAERHEEVGRLLADPGVIADNARFRALSKEFSQLQPLADALAETSLAHADLAAAQTMRADPEMRDFANEEIASAEARIAELDQRLGLLLIPVDPRDEGNVFLEVRAGTGGDEAAIFAGDLFRMYARYAERHGWQLEVLSSSPGEHGGFKEIVARIEGRGAYSKLKFESGTHRVQRVPATESQGRIHTSAATVAILPELDDIDEIEIRDGDLKIDTFRASGAGGQHVNKTDSAIRITHLPSGMVVECQDERSQHKNRSRAMALMKAKLLAAAQEKHDSEIARDRKLQVGTGDRSERIRTYNFPQARVTDHRINLTLYQLANIMQGKIDELLETLQHEHQAEQLAEEEQRGAA